MKKQQKNQTGFAHPGIIIAVILVVATLAFGGWYVWNKNNKKTDDSTAQSGQEQKQSDSTEGGKYLVIKEWGVRLPLPEDLQGDLTYHASSTATSGTVLFSSRQLNNLTGDDSCSIKVAADGQYSGGIEAVLNRLNPNTYDPNYIDYFRSQLTFIKKLNDYEYYYKISKNPPITCLTGKHEEFNHIQQSISNQLREVFTKLETIN